MKKCLVSKCKRPYACKGYCDTHYYYWKRHGVPFSKRSIEQVAKYGKGTVTPDGYRLLSLNGKRMKEHRWIVEQYLKRKLKPEEHIHHINGNKLDNRIENLKIVSNSEHQIEHTKVYEKEKPCSKCKQVKSLAQFRFRLNNPKSKIRHRFYDSWCKQCYAAVRREWRHRIRSKKVGK